MPVPIVWGIAACLGAFAVRILLSDNVEIGYGPFKGKTS